MAAPHYTTQEIWRPIPGWEGYYEVSSFGRVKSLRRKHGIRFVLCNLGYRHAIKETGADVILKGVLVGRRKAYRSVHLWKDNRQHSRMVHHLVLLAFVGPRPAGAEAHHLDSNPANNAASNLAWVTPEQNKQHARAMGRFSLSPGRPRKS